MVRFVGMRLDINNVDLDAEAAEVLAGDIETFIRIRLEPDDERDVCVTVDCIMEK